MIIELLNKEEYYNVSNTIEIAKGRFKASTTLSEALYLYKRKELFKPMLK